MKKRRHSSLTYEVAKAFCNLHEITKTFHCIFDDNSTIIFFLNIFSCNSEEEFVTVSCNSPEDLVTVFCSFETYAIP